MLFPTRKPAHFPVRIFPGQLFPGPDEVIIVIFIIIIIVIIITLLLLLITIVIIIVIIIIIHPSLGTEDEGSGLWVCRLEFGMQAFLARLT